MATTRQFLAWDGALGSPMEALDFVAERRRIDVDRLTTPSQRRYLQYFSNMLDLSLIHI